VKCEIHDCSLVLIDFFGFDNRDKILINKLKKLRTNVQYYLAKPKSIDEKAVASFVLKCQHIFNSLSYDEIEDIRSSLQKRIEESNSKKKIKSKQKKGEIDLNSKRGTDDGNKT